MVFFLHLQPAPNSTPHHHCPPRARTRRLARLRGAEEREASERDAAAALALARRFRSVIASRWREFAEVPDRAPAGLYTGLAGSACFLADTVLREGGVCGAMVRKRERERVAESF